MRFIQGTTLLPSFRLCKEQIWPRDQIDPSGYKLVAVITAGMNYCSCWHLPLLGSLLPSSLLQFITALNNKASVLSNILSCPKYRIPALWQTWKESRNRQCLPAHEGMEESPVQFKVKTNHRRSDRAARTRQQHRESWQCHVPTGDARATKVSTYTASIQLQSEIKLSSSSPKPRIRHTNNNSETSNSCWKKKGS